MAQARPGEPGGAGRFGGTVAGRYRLDEPRPADLPGAERWSATDQILARPVTVTLVSGPRTTAVLDAARRAALVVDPRLARILDVGQADGTGYVVTEAVEGRSLAALAARAPLSPDQARAVVGEAAAALEAARRRGVHHLALRPEAVLLTSASRVVVDGLAVDGELIGAAGGGAHAMSRTDTVGLVRVLYAALTGRWPAPGTDARASAGAVPTFDEWSTAGGSAPAAGPPIDAGLPDAPQHDDVPLPPADLVAGVPADLDTLCVVTLGPHDDGPHSPGELVRELEPWRAVRADEVFRAADAGRWHALPDQGAARTPEPARATSDSSAGGPGAASAAAATAVGGSGASAAAAGAAGTGAAAAGAGAGSAPGAAGAIGAAGAVGAAGAIGTAGAVGAAGAAAGIGGGVARQSVRSAFAGGTGPGARRPGTPPPATPAPASFPPAPTGPGPERATTRPVPTAGADGPGRTSGSSPASRTGTAADVAATQATGSALDAVPAATDAPDAAGAPAPMPPSIPPGGGAPQPAATAASATPPDGGVDDGAADDLADDAGSGPAGSGAAGSGPAGSDAAGSDASASGTTEQEPGTPVDDDPAATDGHPAPPLPSAAAAAVVGIVSAPSVTAGESDRDVVDPADDATDTPDDPSGPDEKATDEGATPEAEPDDAGPANATPPGPARRSTSAFAVPAAAPPPTGTLPAGTPPAGAETASPDSAAPVAAPDPAEEPPVETVRFDPIGPPPGDDGGSGPDTPAWDLPFPAEEPRESFGRRRFDPSRWVLGLVAIGVVVGVVVAVGNVLKPFSPGDDGAAAPAPVVTPSAPPATEAPADDGDGDGDGGTDEAPATDPPVIAGVTSIDPSDGDGEHEELVGRLTDGDPATSWYTHTYNRPDFAGFKEAVGLAITLQAPATVTSITLDVNGTGGTVEVRSTDAANPTAGDVLASGALNGQTVLTLSQPTETQSLVVWFTSLAQTPDGANKIEISNIAVG